MVGPFKNIQWWWSKGNKTIEKPSKSMVAWKKNINHSIALKSWPSLWSNIFIAFVFMIAWSENLFYPTYSTFSRRKRRGQKWHLRACDAAPPFLTCRECHIWLSVVTQNFSHARTAVVRSWSSHISVMCWHVWLSKQWRFGIVAMIDRLTTNEHQLQVTVMELSLTCNHLRYLVCPIYTFTVINNWK